MSIFTVSPITWTNDTVNNTTTFNNEIKNKMTDIDDVATGAEVTSGVETTKLVTPKAIGDADVNTRLKSKTGVLSRAMTAASGNVLYTGIGFMPTSITFHSFVDFYPSFSWSMVDSNKTAQGMFFYTGVNGNYLSAATANACIHGASSAVDSQTAFLLSYEADGFILTWTKLNSPTNGLYVCYIAYR